MKNKLKKYHLLIYTATIIVVLDQVTKAWIQKTMTLHQSIPVIPDFFNLTFIKNPGAAFGLFAESGGTFRTAFFIIVSFLAVGVLTYLYANTPGEFRLMRLALSLVMGGAIGNLIDRVRFGEVVDFLDFYIGRYHWPAFNVADSCITVGVTFLIAHSLINRKEDSGMAAPS